MKLSSSLYHHALMQGVRRAIDHYHLLPSGARVLVALSGGADSVALLRALHLQGYTVRAVHVNFRLRGAESDRDEAFCRSLCRSLEIPLEVASFDTLTIAQERGISIEMAARDLRYELFSQVASRYAVEAIAVAHHLQDNVETLLANFLRGTGIAGLRGMKPKRENIIRPLLEVAPEDIYSFLALLGQSYCQDSTNRDVAIKRNAIRHRILPLLGEFNPNILSTSLGTLAHLREVEQIYDEGITTMLERASLPPFMGALACYDVALLLGTGVVHSLLHHITKGCRFSREEVEQLAQNLSLSQPHRLTSSTHWLEKRQGVLSLFSKETLPHPLSRTLTLPLEKFPTAIETPYGTLTSTWEEQFTVQSPSNNTIYVDSEALAWAGIKELTLEAIDLQETIEPLGLKGSKTIKKILKEKRLPEPLWQSVPMLKAADTALWLMPYTRTAAYCISATSKAAYQITLQSKSL